jgi:hypothetical protein
MGIPSHLQETAGGRAQFARAIPTRAPGAKVPATLAAVLLAALWIPLGVAARDSSPNWDPKPPLIVDLRAAGFVPWQQKTAMSDSQFFARFNPAVDPSIFENQYPHPVFLDEDTLAISFARKVYRDLKEEEDPRSIPVGVRLHVWLFDAHTRALITKREFLSVFRRWFNGGWDTQSMLIPLSDGKFLIHADARLMLFDREFRLLGERELPQNPEMSDSGGLIVFSGGPRKGYSEMWAVRVGTGGRTLLVQHFLDGRYTLEWLNRETLKTLWTQEAPTAVHGVSDSFATYGWFRSIRVLSAEGGSREVCSRGKTCEGGVGWALLEGDQVIVPRQWSFSVMSLTGEILWSREGHIRGNGVWSALPSLEGNRFVLSYEAWRAGSFGEAELKPGDNDLVYDAIQRKLVFQARLEKGIASPALSPTGSRLALLGGTEIAIYDLPTED